MILISKISANTPLDPWLWRHTSLSGVCGEVKLYSPWLLGWDKEKERGLMVVVMWKGIPFFQPILSLVDNSLSNRGKFQHLPRKDDLRRLMSKVFRKEPTSRAMPIRCGEGFQKTVHFSGKHENLQMSSTGLPSAPRQLKVTVSKENRFWCLMRQFHCGQKQRNSV